MTTVSVKGENYDIKVSANIGEQDLICAVSDFIENINTIEKQDADHMETHNACVDPMYSEE